MIAIRFRPDSISIQGPAGDVITKNGVKCIATTTLPLSSMQKYDYSCNREEVTIWLPYLITNLKGFSPAPRDDSETDYSRVKISISEKEPILKLLSIAESERITCSTATCASNCNYLMYDPESLMSGTPIIRNVSGAYYNHRMNITTIHDYNALNNHIRGSEIDEVCDGKLRIGSLETGLLTLKLDKDSGNYRFSFEYVRKLNKFLGQRRTKVRVEFGVPFRPNDQPVTPLCLIAREKYYTTFLVAAKV